MSNTLPTTVRLQRFHIDLSQLRQEYEAWTLPFPFTDAVDTFQHKIHESIKSKVKGEYIGVPYRVLNNAIMVLSPTLTHAFEKVGDARLALVVGTPNCPAQFPSTAHLRRIVRHWAHHWAGHNYIKDNIPADYLQELMQTLDANIQTTTSDWKWIQHPIGDFLRERQSNPISYNAIPSLIASILHGQTSYVAVGNDQKPIRWRKVQEDNGHLSVVSSPFWTSYTDQRGNPGDGYFAYKIRFGLQTQSGSDRFWLFMGLHAQRYAEEKLTASNSGRNVSVLIGANRSRMDDFPFDSTLVRLSADFGTGIWQDDLASLLNAIGVKPDRGIVAPSVLWDTNDPMLYWNTSNMDARVEWLETFNNEYYVVHSEGYKYANNGEPEVKTSYSQTERNDVISDVLTHLPMLISDTGLSPDTLKTPSGSKKPRAMRHSGEKIKRAPDEMEHLVKRALRGEPLHIVLLYCNPNSYEALYSALKTAFFLADKESFPPNVYIHSAKIPEHLHSNLAGGRMAAHRNRVREWQDFIEERVLTPGAGFPEGEFKGVAFVERVVNKEEELGLGIYGVIRDACSASGFASQMVGELSFTSSANVLQISDKAKHRVQSAAREIALSHIGGLYGPVNEIYRAAGIDHELEIIAFYLKRELSNVLYPLAVKIAYDGAIEACFPNGSSDEFEWKPYTLAAVELGRFVSKQWTLNTWNSKQKLWQQPVRAQKQSPLVLSHLDLSRFVLNVLSNLEKPTIGLIEAANWRNEGTWPQLRNADLYTKRDILDFNASNKQQTIEIIPRTDPRYKNLLGIVRMRAGDETPQYTTDTFREFTQLSGFIDSSNPNMLHYFSIGEQLENAKDQRRHDRGRKVRYATKFDGGAGVAYKAPQVIEFVPFFVREDYISRDEQIKLCRVMSYLRISPAWQIGNVIRPYPMHLAHKLIDDMLDILAGE